MPRKNQEQKIDNMHGLLHEMKPVVEGIARDIKSLDARQREVELRSEQHHGRIKRLEQDVDGLGRRVRHPRDARAQDGYRLRWGELVEFMTALPYFWHLAAGLGGTVLLAVGFILRNFKI